MYEFFAREAQHITRPPSFFDSDSRASEFSALDPVSIDEYERLPIDRRDIRMPDIAGALEPAEKLSQHPRIPDSAPADRPYIIISTEHNRLWLMQGREILRAAVCATGTGDTLRWEAGGRKWVFNTPRGEFTVQYKTSNPRWVPPEWHYVEQGIDPPDWLTRAREADYDMLGDAAINFGGDYHIHGTLFEGLLGRSVTHGCVRIGSRDLAFIYPRVGRGTRVFIY